MYALWPPELPQSPLLGSQQALTGTAIRSPVDIGLPKQRRRYGATARPLSMQMRLTLSQWDRFQHFYDQELADGTLPFQWRHPHTRILALWRFDPTSPPTAVKDGPTLLVNLQVERIPDGVSP